MEVILLQVLSNFLSHPTYCTPASCYTHTWAGHINLSIECVRGNTFSLHFGLWYMSLALLVLDEVQVQDFRKFFPPHHVFAV